MSTGTLISLDEYLERSFKPDCDYVDGEVVERQLGKRRHSYAQAQIAAWFSRGNDRLHPFTEWRTRVGKNRIRIPDVLVLKGAIPDEEVLTSPPYLCIEILSPDDTMSAMQQRLDDYLAFGIQELWVIDPWKHRGWNVTSNGWSVAQDAIMRTSDGLVAMPLIDVLLPLR